MSVDYYFDKSISAIDIETKTDLKIEKKYNGLNFIVDKYGNAVAIYDGLDSISHFTCYGTNNSTYIKDALVKIFNVKFLDDDTFEIYVRINSDLLNETNDELRKQYKNDDLYLKTMSILGYVLTVNGKYEVPNRTEIEYKKHSI